MLSRWMVCCSFTVNIVIWLSSFFNGHLTFPQPFLSSQSHKVFRTTTQTKEDAFLLQIETINSGTFHPAFPDGKFNLGCAQLQIFTLRSCRKYLKPKYGKMRGSAKLRYSWWLSRRSIMISSFALTGKGGHGIPIYLCLY